MHYTKHILTWIGLSSVTLRTCCETNLQQLWRQVFCTGMKLWNSFPAELRQADSNFQ